MWLKNHKKYQCEEFSGLKMFHSDLVFYNIKTTSFPGSWKQWRFKYVTFFNGLYLLWALQVSRIACLTFPASQNRFHSWWSRWRVTLNILDSLSYLRDTILIIIWIEIFLIPAVSINSNIIFCIHSSHSFSSKIRFILIFIRMN